MPTPTELRVCIIAENASFLFGGEASLPLQYFSRLRARGIEAWLIVHGRTRQELELLFPNDRDRIHFVADRWFHKLIWRASLCLPRRLSEASFGTMVVLINQLIQRRMARKLIARHRVNLIHQPIPVSPRAPSFICKLGVPVVIGPMNGGMEYPPAFRGTESWLTRSSVAIARGGANWINRLIPGKRFAEVLLVANQRTRLALPDGLQGRVIEIVENAVDTELWSERQGTTISEKAATFVFVGRLVDWKRVDLAIEALANVPGARLTVIGDGPMRAPWGMLADKLDVKERVSFVGWLPQRECARHLHSATALLLPSIYECGGAVVLEAMAAGTPAIATAWGGPAEYIDESCGILVQPSSAAAVVEGFTIAMKLLIDDPEVGRLLGEAGRRKIQGFFDWNKKLDLILDVFAKAVFDPSISPLENTLNLAQKTKVASA